VRQLVIKSAELVVVVVVMWWR